MKIAIIGCGAMGILFGGYLSKSEDVTIIDHRKDRSKYIKENGIQIEEPKGSVQFYPGSVTETGGSPFFDIIFICVKAFDTKSAAITARSLSDSDTIVVSLQNGYGNREIIEQETKSSHIVMGTTSEASTLLSTGEVRHAAWGETYLGTVTGTERDVQTAAKLLNEAGFKAHVCSNIEERIWKKLFVNAGINALCAVLGKKNRVIFEDAGISELAQKLVHEAVLVANCMGYSFEAEAEAESMLSVARTTGDNSCSMLQDIINHRQTEIDYINGMIVRLADECGVEVPHNHFVTSLIKALGKRP